ncbi:MAG: hypothetical protein WD940_00250 [Patescibacteria group bacterium]
MWKKMARFALKHRRWELPLLVAFALFLIGGSLQTYHREHPSGLELQYRAFSALAAQDPLAAYALFIESAVSSDDPAVRAISLYNAANVAWEFEMADYQTLVELYKESLRNRPGFYPASWNLELLYFLKSQAPELLPKPGGGPFPGEEEYVPTGEI